MSTDADHDWLDKSVDAPTVPVGCHRSHPHENMDDTCERFAQYERENARLREELATREALYKEQWRRAEQAEARALAAEKDVKEMRAQFAWFSSSKQRFDRDTYADDSAFADWVQSRSRLYAAIAEAKHEG